jgi:hypothetical protein
VDWWALPGLALAGLLAAAGAIKVVDPSTTVGALRAIGLPSYTLLVRSGAMGEVVLGVCAIAFGGEIAWLLVALSYAAFACFVAWALRLGTPIGSCGCFGRADTPPHPVHVSIDLVAAFVAIQIARWMDGAPLDEVTGHPLSGLLAAAGAGALAYAGFRAFTRRPATR